MSENRISPRHLIAPCGLDCSRCVGCAEGSVATHAREISSMLGDNFQMYADRLKSFNPAMENYRPFRELLDALSAPSCGGCRSENRTCLPDCRVSDCVKNTGVEFCFECREFPDCGKTGLPESLQARWQKNNELMREHGVDEFIKFQSNKPRYP